MGGFMKYQIFHTIEDSEKYCFSATVIEKKSKLFFNAQKTPFNTNSSLWGTSSVEFLRILLYTLYQIRDIYSDYDSLNWLEKHGEYSCAVTPQVRQMGNRLSGLAGTAYASLLA